MTAVPAQPVAVPAPGAGGLARTTALGAGIGFLISVVAVTAVLAANGAGVAALGAGIMVAGFDGLPFGAMLGAMVHFMRHPEE
jgi:hypothetical protein